MFHVTTKYKIQTFCSLTPASPLLCSSFSPSSVNCTSLITMRWRGGSLWASHLHSRRFFKSFQGKKKKKSIFCWKRRGKKEEGGDLNQPAVSVPPSCPTLDLKQWISANRLVDFVTNRQEVWETIWTGERFFSEGLFISLFFLLLLLCMAVVFSLSPNGGNRVSVTPNTEQYLLTPPPHLHSFSLFDGCGWNVFCVAMRDPCQ